MSHIEEFREAMGDAGIKWNGPIHDDRKIHRFVPEGGKDESGWYVLHPPDPIAGGAFGCWRSVDKVNWHQKNGVDRTPQEMAAVRRQWDEAEKKRQVDETERQERFAKRAAEYFKDLKPPSYNHLYFQSKLVVAFGPIVENDTGDLAIPLQDINGKIWSYQTIDCLGDKLYMPGARKRGCFFPVCDKQDGPLIICEGYATGATVHEATGYATFAAMDCGNLLEVAKACREKWKDRPILIASDNDRFTQKQGESYNPGLEKAKQAAVAVKGILVVPEFPAESKGSDFNDLDKECGRESVVSAFNKAYTCPMSFLSFEQIGKIPTNTVDKLYGDHLLDRGSNLVILGQGGVGKSRLVYQMIAAPHLGLPKFLTIDVHPGARNFKWLVIQVENGIERLKSERETLLKMLGSNFVRFNEFVRVLTPLEEHDSFVNLDDPENVRRIKQAIDFHSPDGLIFDSLYDFSVGDLNKDSDMRATLTAITRLSRHRNPKRAIILLHHATTGASGAAKAVGYDRSSFARNSKVIYNWARAQINIAPMDGDSNGKLVVSCGKCSNGKEFTPFAVTLNEDNMRYEVDADTDVAEWAREMGGKNAPDITPEEVAEMASSSGITRTGLSKRIMESLGCNRQSAYRYIRKSLSKGKIRESGELLFRNSV